MHSNKDSVEDAQSLVKKQKSTKDKVPSNDLNSQPPTVLNTAEDQESLVDEEQQTEESIP